MRISEAFCKMRLSEYCTSQDVDRAIAVTVDSFVGGQKVSCKKALARAFAKYVFSSLSLSLSLSLPSSLFPLLFSFPVPFSSFFKIKSNGKISKIKEKRGQLTPFPIETTDTHSQSRARSGVRTGGTGSLVVGRGPLRPRRSWLEHYLP